MQKAGFQMAMCVLLFVLLAGAVRAEEAVVPGELIIEPPTLICLGFEWRIEGDDNLNASAEIEYRKAGAGEWRKALPLRRISYDTRLGEDGGRLEEKRTVHALTGSILDLEEDTEYEVRLTLVDPDGAEGEPVETVTLRTRAEPVPFRGGEVRHVYPPRYKGEKQQPAYRSIMHAVNGFHPWCDCYQTVHPNAAPPGTIIKLHPGKYRIDRFNYREPTQRWLHGTITLVADGTPEKPIAIVGVGDGEVIIDGAGNWNLFNVIAADYLYFDNLTIQNTDIAFHGGFQGVMGCKGLTVKNCRMENVVYGVLAQDGRSENFYIGDNRFIGRNPGDRFNPRSGGAWGKTEAGYAVNLSGKGHVVCYNYAANFWDVINVFTSAMADPFFGQQARAIDIYNNDLYNATDNFIEADGSFANTRIMRNRCFNCMATPLSVQPVYQGPVYWVRNVVFNAKGAFKLAGGRNVLAFHNFLNGHQRMDFTSHEVFYNNVFCGPAIESGDRRKRGVLNVKDVENTVRDYNAFRVAGERVDWMFKAGDEQFRTLEAFSRATGLERHGITFESYDIFADAIEATYADSNEDPLVDPDTVDLMPADGSPLIDAGVVISNINEDFEGDAPDVGPYEKGWPKPHYGPRTDLPSELLLREPEDTPAEYVPEPLGEVVLRVNCGAEIPYVDPAGNRWAADRKRAEGRWGWTGESGDVLRSGVAQGSPLQQMLLRERYGMDAYVFPVKNGTYAVRLHFNEGFLKATGERIFTVTAEGETVVDGMDVFKTAGGRNRALSREFEVRVNDGELRLEFSATEDNPMVCGIEVFRK